MKNIILSSLFIINFYSVSSSAETTESVSNRVANKMTTYWPQTFWHSLLSRWSMQKEAYPQAYDHTLKALETDPLSPELQINLGNAMEGMGSLSRARDAYASAEKLSKDDALISFESRFNQAQAYGKEKKIEEALNYYQKALEIDPQSLVVKTNIELLLSGQGGGGGKGDKNKDKDKGKDSQEGDQDKDKEQSNKPPHFDENRKQNPSNGKKSPEDLSQGDIKKILEEIKQQEQKIRGDYYKQGNNEQKQKATEGKREKDW